MTVPCALYCRISSDDLKLGKGIERQLEDTRRLAQQRGWEIVAEHIDNDVSAFSNKERLGYRALMADVESGRVNKIVIYHQSRLWRNRVDRSRGIERLAHLGVGIEAVSGPALDFSTSGGRLLADLLGAFDTAESEVKSERIIRATQQRAEEGRAHGRVLYGWRREYESDSTGRILGFRDLEHAEHAEIVREIVRRLLAGEALSRIARDLNERGVPAPQSGHWLGITLKQLATRPANVSERVYRGKVMGKAAWPALVSRDDHDRVVALLSAPERHQHRDGKRRHLLTNGVAYCGACGGTLGARHKRGVLIYRCVVGCMSRDLAKVDQLVRDVVVARLSQPDARGIFDSHDDADASAARERAEAVRARLDNAAMEYANGDIDAGQLRIISARLRPELEAAEAEMRRYRPVALPSNVDELHGERAAEAWDALPVTARRKVLEALGLTIEIARKSGPGSFNPEEIKFQWQSA